MKVKYKKGVESELQTGSRTVVSWNEGVVFRCPCDERQVYISSKIHSISFDEEGLLTLNGSCGYNEKKSLKRKQNWCHFFIKNGEIEMCGDSECPGSKL